jgi:hypothetical protein
MTRPGSDDRDREQVGETEYGDDSGAGEPTVGGPAGLGAALKADRRPRCPAE